MTNPHFAWLPPEINSALMFAGPGAGPLLAAAAAWSGLADDLAASASAFGSVTSELAGNAWLGPSSAAMMAVATKYVGLLSAAAVQAGQAATQASATAAAFETALAATVQPAVVAANRALQQVLASTNWLGQNAPAIMDIEGAYEQMWALDVSAMAAYHVDASEAAAVLAPWREILQMLGIEVNTNGQISFGFGNSGGGNIGGGNNGNNNLGLGNMGNGNLGFGNTGNNDIGFGLTGNNQIGFGGLNSGSGNIGFGNSGTGNIGFFNSGNGNFGIGNAGTSNAGLFNSGSVNAGLANSGVMNNGVFNTGTEQSGFAGQASTADSSLLNSSHAVTGGLTGANVGSSLLNSAASNTGGLNAGLRHLVAEAGPAASFGPSAAAAGFDGASVASAASSTSPSAVPNAGLRAAGTYSGFITAANSTANGEPRPREVAANGTSIPKSSFYPDREADEAETSLRFPLRAE